MRQHEIAEARAEIIKLHEVIGNNGKLIWGLSKREGERLYIEELVKETAALVGDIELLRANMLKSNKPARLAKAKEELRDATRALTAQTILCQDRIDEIEAE